MRSYKVAQRNPRAPAQHLPRAAGPQSLAHAQTTTWRCDSAPAASLRFARFPTPTHLCVCTLHSIEFYLLYFKIFYLYLNPPSSLIVSLPRGGVDWETAGSREVGREIDDVAPAHRFVVKLEIS